LDSKWRSISLDAVMVHGRRQSAHHSLLARCLLIGSEKSWASLSSTLLCPHRQMIATCWSFMG
jgi:hypothetical protein